MRDEREWKERNGGKKKRRERDERGGGKREMGKKEQCRLVLSASGK